MRISQDFESCQYSSIEEVEQDSPTFRVTSEVELNSSTRRLRMNTIEHQDWDRSQSETFTIDVELSEWTELKRVLALLRKQIRNQDDRSRSIPISVESGTAYETSTATRKKGFDEIVVTVDNYRIEVSSGPISGYLPHYEKLVDGAPQDRRNAVEFLEIISEYFEQSDDREMLDVHDRDLRGEAVPEYLNGHYQSCVRTAFRILEERIRDAGDYPQNLTGDDLAKEAFKVDGGDLAFADVNAEKAGWMFLYAGAFASLRNPPSHRDDQFVNQRRAKQILHFVDYLLDVLETRANSEEM